LIGSPLRIPLVTATLLLTAAACVWQLGAKVDAAPVQKNQIPHGQTRPPGPGLSPAEAIARMKVPEGFQVELVAAEPDLVNPVAMTFDERAGHLQRRATGLREDHLRPGHGEKE
jgi:hypothetical protein